MFRVMCHGMLNSISGRISLGSYGAIDGLTRHFAEGLDKLGTQESGKTFQIYGQSFDDYFALTARLLYPYMKLVGPILPITKCR